MLGVLGRRDQVLVHLLGRVLVPGRLLHRGAAAQVEVPAGQAGGAAGHGRPLQQQHPGAGPGRLQGRAAARDAEADDRHVIRVGAVGQHRRGQRGWQLGCRLRLTAGVTASSPRGPPAGPGTPRPIPAGPSGSPHRHSVTPASGPAGHVVSGRLGGDQHPDVRGARPARRRPGLPQRGRLGADVPFPRGGQPAVGVLGDPAERLRAAARADDQRQVRLHRLGERPARPERHELPVVRRFRLGPQRAHRRHVLGQHGAPLAGRNAMIGQLVGVPAEAGADRHPAAGQVVQRGDRLGQRYRVGFGGQRHRGAEPDPRRHRGRGGQRHPRVEGAQVPVVGQRRTAGARVRGGPPDRDVRVLRHVERVEAAILGRLGGLGGRDPAIAGEQDDAVPHALRLEPVLVTVQPGRCRQRRLDPAPGRGGHPVPPGRAMARRRWPAWSSAPARRDGRPD